MGKEGLMNIGRRRLLLVAPDHIRHCQACEEISSETVLVNGERFVATGN